ncbi:hypothetical protein MAUB_09930 [Mycolicibacterium aubagnense]|uniref:Uncharacterized protein n=1 Tax=Mycolicibacterium aubagnense TaxID=319707 RepID=A0ABN5YMT9_9MYCO|nr:hypothetical protein MAUB_09930 [Mycolicibacterium aubagnense]
MCGPALGGAVSAAGTAGGVGGAGGVGSATAVEVLVATAMAYASDAAAMPPRVIDVMVVDITARPAVCA